jgi:hypothetical protein
MMLRYNISKKEFYKIRKKNVSFNFNFTISYYSIYLKNANNCVSVFVISYTIHDK